MDPRGTNGSDVMVATAAGYSLRAFHPSQSSNELRALDSSEDPRIHRDFPGQKRDHG
jgi:hypothetical protein